ncbi:MAG: rhomboid family intramembrane serine protease [Gemmataceae bacterium]
MVFPLFDDNTDRRTWPVVNIGLIVVNFLVFIFPQQASEEGNAFTYAWSVVPEEIRTGRDIEGEVKVVNPITGETQGVIELQRTPVSVYLTLLTSMFMHGGWAHLLGNMLFLWIFGDNVEDYLGHVVYLVFYLTCGILASLAHVGSTFLFHMSPFIPSLGASGAISGVLGGYLLLYPHKPVTVIMLRFLTTVPAWVAIGMWFLFQIIESLGVFGGQPTGVAYGAHIGGFVAGLALVRVFGWGKSPPVAPGPRRVLPAWRSR